MKKKNAIIISSAFVLLFAILFAAPYLFKDKIINAIGHETAKNINAKIYFDDISLSFIRSFPNLRVTVDNLTIVGKGEFKRDTLAHADDIYGVIDLRSLFSDDGYRIDELSLDKPAVNLIAAKNGHNNWDIVKKKDNKKDNADSRPFRLSLKKLKIKEGHISYNNLRDDIYAEIGCLNHKSKGDFSSRLNDMTTENEWKDTHLTVGKIKWIDGYNIKLNAKLNADIDNSRYEISDNELNINEVELKLNGWLKIISDGKYDMDIAITANECEFKDIISLIPTFYSKQFDDIKTGGTVKVSGFAKGSMNTTGKKNIYPKFGMQIDISNGWLQYPNLPDRISSVKVRSSISNPGGDIDNTVIKVNRFSLSMAGSPINGKLKISKPASDPDIDIEAKGRINLSRIKDVYPLDNNQRLSGIADINLKAKGRLSYYEKKMYDRFIFSGELNLQNLRFVSPNTAKPIDVSSAKMIFTSRYVDVPELNIKVGNSDLNANGHLDNIVTYVLRNDTLRGSLNTRSNYLNICDILTSSNANSHKRQEQQQSYQKARTKNTKNIIVLPTDLDIKMTSTFQRIVFNRIDITDAHGQFELRGGKLKMRDISLNGMGGFMSLNGEYDTWSNPDVPRCTGEMNINNILYSEVFRQVKSAKQLVPLFGKTKGRFSGNSVFNIPLGDNMMPDLNLMTAKGSISSNNITISNVEALHKISKLLKRDELYDPEISQVTIPYEIKGGKVFTDNFSFNIADTKINIDKGYTGIDRSIDYKMNVDIPTSESTVIKISKASVHISGNIDKPQIKVQTKEMWRDAGKTIKKNIDTTFKSATRDMREEWKESRSDIKENMREAGNEIKNTFKSIFKRNKN